MMKHFFSTLPQITISGLFRSRGIKVLTIVSQQISTYLLEQNFRIGCLYLFVHSVLLRQLFSSAMHQKCVEWFLWSYHKIVSSNWFDRQLRNFCFKRSRENFFFLDNIFIFRHAKKRIFFPAINVLHSPLLDYHLYELENGDHVLVILTKFEDVYLSAFGCFSIKAFQRVRSC